MDHNCRISENLRKIRRGRRERRTEDVSERARYENFPFADARPKADAARAKKVHKFFFRYIRRRDARVYVHGIGPQEDGLENVANNGYLSGVGGDGRGNV